MDQKPENPTARHFVLPSGRRVEVVSLELETPAPRKLHTCPECGSGLVQPLQWRELSDDSWELVLHCPNCDWLAAGPVSDAEIERIEEELDDGLIQMLDDLRRLTQTNMAQEVDCFTSALEEDLILPEDF